MSVLHLICVKPPCQQITNKTWCNFRKDGEDYHTCFGFLVSESLQDPPRKSVYTLAQLLHCSALLLTMCLNVGTFLNLSETQFCYL